MAENEKEQKEELKEENKKKRKRNIRTWYQNKIMMN